MPKLTRIYTRTGDDGTTGLVGGQRTKKNDPRIDGYGTIDELSSAIGLARAALAEAQRTRPVQDLAARGRGRRASSTRGSPGRKTSSSTSAATSRPWPRIAGRGCRSSPATTRSRSNARSIAPSATSSRCDTFIHPGGSLTGAFLHQARTIARRAERLLVPLRDREEISPEAMRYLNRLSDALFVWSRWINHALDQPEHRWNAKTEPPP